MPGLRKVLHNPGLNSVLVTKIGVKKGLLQISALQQAPPDFFMSSVTIGQSAVFYK